MVKADGGPVQLICNALEARDAEGRPAFIRLALFKATDRRRYEQELLQAREAATSSLASERETSELREQFIAVLGHDLRNPLASISAGARIIGRDAKTEKEHQVVAMMQTTVMRMAGLIDNVLDFARGRLGGGITLIGTTAPRSSPCCIKSSMNCGCLHRDETSMPLRDRSTGGLEQVPNWAVGFQSRRQCHQSRVGQRACPCACGNNRWIVQIFGCEGGEPIPEAAMEKLFEPFFRGEVRASRRASDLDCTLPRKSRKLTTACCRSPRPPGTGISPSRCRFGNGRLLRDEIPCRHRPC